MWILLQVAVLLMYWDIPPQDLTNHGEAGVIVVEEDEEEDNDDESEQTEDEEGKPLVGTQESLGSYGTLPDEPTRAVANGSLPYQQQPGSPEPGEDPGATSPLKVLSASRGEGTAGGGGVGVGGEEWGEVRWWEEPIGEVEVEVGGGANSSQGGRRRS